MPGLPAPSLGKVDSAARRPRSPEFYHVRRAELRATIDGMEPSSGRARSLDVVAASRKNEVVSADLSRSLRALNKCS